MATSLRTVGQLLKRAVRADANVLLQQQRGAADMYYKPNKHIEAWSKRREELEFEFQWDRPSTAKVVLLGIAVPLGLYHLLCYTAHKEDEWNGREERRSFMWSAAPAAPQQQ